RAVAPLVVTLVGVVRALEHGDPGARRETRGERIERVATHRDLEHDRAGEHEERRARQRARAPLAYVRAEHQHHLAIEPGAGRAAPPAEHERERAPGESATLEPMAEAPVDQRGQAE